MLKLLEPLDSAPNAGRESPRRPAQRVRLLFRKPPLRNLPLYIRELLHRCRRNRHKQLAALGPQKLRQRYRVKTLLCDGFSWLATVALMDQLEPMFAAEITAPGEEE